MNLLQLVGLLFVIGIAFGLGWGIGSAIYSALLAIVRAVFTALGRRFGGWLARRFDGRPHLRVIEADEATGNPYPRNPRLRNHIRGR